MSTTYTPNPSNDPASYTLPSDLDDAVAESVNLPLRNLADKVHHAYQVFAQLATSNVFTAGPLEVDDNDATHALLKTTKTSTNDPAGSGNDWKLVLDLGSNARVYTGVNTGAVQGGFIITYNARWVPGSPGHWEPPNTGAGSIQLSWNYGNVYLSAQIAVSGGGPATWTSWPGYGSATRGDLFVARNVNVGGALSVVGSATITGNALCDGDFIYSPTQSRLPMPIPLSGGTFDFSIAGDPTYSSAKAPSGSQRKYFPLRLPQNCGSVTIEVMFNQASASPSAYFIEKIDPDFTGLSLTVTTVATANTPSASGVNKLSLSIASVALSAEYRLAWICGNTGDLLYAARATSMQDNGPLNTL